MPRQINTTRRSFLKTTAAGAAALSSGVWSQLAAQESKSPNEKLNVACVGVANRASASVNAVKGENIVALCDVDSNYLDRVAAQSPDAKKYRDYREMFEDLGDKLDAATVATSDHHHAPASIRAIRKGLHVFCELAFREEDFQLRLVIKTAAMFIITCIFAVTHWKSLAVQLRRFSQRR